MSGSGDDFIDALNYQVKEEIINNYFRERLILEEEIAEYDEVIAEYRKLEGEVRDLRDQLACLLVNQKNFREFFSLLGFSKPPLNRLGHGNLADRAPSCPIGLTPRGFTKKGRYVKMTLDTYGMFSAKATVGKEKTEAIFALANEINNDIKKFNLNFDLMSIISFLKSLDTDMRMKKKIMGDNFSVAEIGSLEISMTFNKLVPRSQGIRVWPDLPTATQAEKLTVDFLRNIFRIEREVILPALG